MKKWINDIDGIDIKKAFENIEEEKTPPELDGRILDTLKTRAAAPVAEKDKVPLYKKLLPAGIAAAAVLVTFFLLFNIITGNPGFTITRIDNHVFFKQGSNDIVLKKGNRIKTGYRILSGEASQCVLAYRDQAFIDIHERTEILTAVHESNRFLFDLIDGSLLVDEHIQKGVLIEIRTARARVHAIGTRYTVVHSAKNGETVIQALEGTLQIEPVTDGRQIILKTGEEVILGQNGVPDIKEIDIQDKRITTGWKINVINEKSLLNEPIIGIDTHAGLMIVCTEHSVSCLTESESLWVDVIKPRTIQAQPYIYNDNVYVLLENEIFVYDIYTGNRKTGVKMNEHIKTGYGFVPYDNQLFLVFASGIYRFSPDTGIIDLEPFIPVPGASMPVAGGNILYFASYMTNIFFACDRVGDIIWSCSLDSRSDCLPVVLENSILAGTKDGFLYKISTNGEIENKLDIKETIVSILSTNESVFVCTGRRNLYRIGLADFRIKEVSADIDAAITNGYLFVSGNGKGMITILDTETATEKEILLPYSRVHIFTNGIRTILAGLENGGLIELVCE